MRPGQSCPGVGRYSLLAMLGLGQGFNEAGAIMPRSGPDNVQRGIAVLQLQ